MFEKLFSKQLSRTAHSKLHFSDKLEEYAYDMLDLGYKHDSVREHLWCWERFIRWLYSHKIKITDVSENSLEDFTHFSYALILKREKRYPCPCFAVFYRRKLSKLLCYLRQDKLVPNLPRKVFWYSQGMEEYCHFLSTYAGLSEKTIKSKYQNIVLFFEHTEISGWDNLSVKISAANIDSFMKKRCEALSTSLRKDVASCLRSAFRYWHLAGTLSEDLSFLVPSIRSYSLSSVPSFISWDEVQQLLQVFDRDIELGKRNYLIILLLATYGWRAGELVNLTLDDINWRNNYIRIYHTKTKITSTYPLQSDVGTAIIDYLQNSRPPTKYRNLIIRARAPAVPFASATGISDVVRRAFYLAGIKPLFSRCGAHMLRHSSAVNMIDHGIPFKTVGDMLGHRSPNSTMIYTKVDLKRLRCATLETIGKYNEK